MAESGGRCHPRNCNVTDSLLRVVIELPETAPSYLALTRNLPVIRTSPEKLVTNRQLPARGEAPSGKSDMLGYKAKASLGISLRPIEGTELSIAGKLASLLTEKCIALTDEMKKDSMKRASSAGLGARCVGYFRMPRYAKRILAIRKPKIRLKNAPAKSEQKSRMIYVLLAICVTVVQEPGAIGISHITTQKSQIVWAKEKI
ncbi:hypothetical protein BDW71DRAFT_206087 [Aspergillus fruticulosus]